ncbi:hypothetical protein [Streptomyces sp. NPDC053431]|uniref:SCO2400 family protein n=1 Tax=Streptomyces sp. NPDC053431 TaxID=3365703 RepID=UPI0037D30177
MDYCSSCRRHLNGALVCPGCGAYAPDIAPTTAGGRIVPASAATTRPDQTAPPETTEAATWHDGRPRDEFAVGAVLEGASGSDAAAEFAGAAMVTEGRAARRRQRARWRKNQRRAVVATAVALVGGGLTVSAMDRQGGDRAQAATAPQDPGAGTAGDQDTPPPSIRPDAQRSSAAPSTSRDDAPAPDRSRRQDPATSLRTTTPPRTEAYAAPRQGSEGAAGKPRSTSPDATAPAPARPSTPDTTGTPDTRTPVPADADGTGATGQEPTTRPDTTPASTSPSEICLLVLCLPVSSP